MEKITFGGDIWKSEFFANPSLFCTNFKICFAFQYNAANIVGEGTFHDLAKVDHISSTAADTPSPTLTCPLPAPIPPQSSPGMSCSASLLTYLLQLGLATPLGL